jgi:hypothetical protein
MHIIPTRYKKANPFDLSFPQQKNNRDNPKVPFAKERNYE